MILEMPTVFFPILSCNIDGVTDRVACTRRMVKVWAEGDGLCPEAECQEIMPLGGGHGLMLACLNVAPRQRVLTAVVV